MLFLSIIMLSSCGKTEDYLGSTEYKLYEVNNSGVSGTAIFKENKDGSTTIVLQLDGSSTDVHPGYIYFNSLAENGSVALTLEPIDCDCESSETVVTKLDNGTAFSYANFVAFNGNIKIHQNINDLETVIAQGNIGHNVSK